MKFKDLDENAVIRPIPLAKALKFLTVLGTTSSNSITSILPIGSLSATISKNAFELCPLFLSFSPVGLWMLETGSSTI